MTDLKNKFYTYRQNNSGGHFDINDDVSIVVIIEAPSASAANSIAEDKGLYFNGCDDGQDCPCCGDRWDACYDDGSEVPEVYGSPADKFESHWVEEGQPVVITYRLDGTVERIIKPKKEEKCA